MAKGNYSVWKVIEFSRVSVKTRMENLPTSLKSKSSYFEKKIP